MQYEPEVELDDFKNLNVTKKYELLLTSPRFNNILLPDMKQPMASNYADMVYEKKEFIDKANIPQNIFFKFKIDIEPLFLYFVLRFEMKLNKEDFSKTLYFDGQNLPEEEFLLKLCILYAPNHYLTKTYLYHATINQSIMNDNYDSLIIQNYNPSKHDITKTYKIKLSRDQQFKFDQYKNSMLIYSFFDSRLIASIARIKRLIASSGSAFEICKNFTWYNKYEALLEALVQFCKGIKQRNSSIGLIEYLKSKEGIQSLRIK